MPASLRSDYKCYPMTRPLVSIGIGRWFAVGFAGRFARNTQQMERQNKRREKKDNKSKTEPADAGQKTEEKKTDSDPLKPAPDSGSW